MPVIVILSDAGSYGHSGWPGTAYLLLNNDNELSLFYHHVLHAQYSNSLPTYLLSLDVDCGLLVQ